MLARTQIPCQSGELTKSPKIPDYTPFDVMKANVGSSPHVPRAVIIRNSPKFLRFRARDRSRTCDLLITNQLLYQLSY